MSRKSMASELSELERKNNTLADENAALISKLSVQVLSSGPGWEEFAPGIQRHDEIPACVFLVMKTPRYSPNKVLIVRENGSNNWGLPVGGHKDEDNKYPMETALRELKEETGIGNDTVVKVEPSVGRAPPILHTLGKRWLKDRQMLIRDGHKSSIVCVAGIIDYSLRLSLLGGHGPPDPITHIIEIADMKWVDINELSALIASEDRECRLRRNTKDSMAELVTVPCIQSFFDKDIYCA